ncbi:MAG: hypothetical protein ABS81_12165 [Pseudonocardia sp. SCN 72-86]|nr:MAG: hypothetical protein ABS81_12165 [Pseudonocardia sp. SCN 72-86]
MTVDVSAHLGEHPLLSWATLAGGTMYAALVPIAEDGRTESGSMTDQATLVLDNLVRAAGGEIENIAQVICSLTDVCEVREFDKVWSATTGSHRPNRAVIGTSRLAVEGIRIELVAYAHIG